MEINQGLLIGIVKSDHDVNSIVNVCDGDMCKHVWAKWMCGHTRGIWWWYNMVTKRPITWLCMRMTNVLQDLL